MLVQKESYCLVCASVRTIIHLLKRVDYLPVQTYKPYYKCILDESKWIINDAISTKICNKKNNVMFVHANTFV